MEYLVRCESAEFVCCVEVTHQYPLFRIPALRPGLMALGLVGAAGIVLPGVQAGFVGVTGLAACTGGLAGAGMPCADF